MTREPGHSTLLSAKQYKICEALPVLQTDTLSLEQHLLTAACLKARSGRSSPKLKVKGHYAIYRNCCSVKGYYAMNGFIIDRHFHCEFLSCEGAWLCILHVYKYLIIPF